MIASISSYRIGTDVIIDWYGTPKVRAIYSEDPGRYAPRQEPTLPRVDNIADLFFRDATDESSAEAPPEASEHRSDNGNTRKRSFLGRNGAAYVADRVGEVSVHPLGRNSRSISDGL